jgi:thiosulfate reductase cytochrome b subunit
MDYHPEPSRDAESAGGGQWVYRHRVSTRLWHWINAICVFVMLMSGLMIFNAHPRLYWGQFGANPDPAWLEIGSRGDHGFVRIGPATLTTTGVLGRSSDASGRVRLIAFPAWATIPSTYDLALARRWHLSFAWLFAAGIAAYALWMVFNGHLRRDLWPRAAELRPRALWADIKRHARLQFPTGASARDYNILQKTSYLGVVLLLIPLLVLTGLTLSPSMAASWPWLLDLFGGRQSARSIHFIAAGLLLLFIVVHLLMVVLSGPLNEVRSMVTGRFRLPKERWQ